MPQRQSEQDREILKDRFPACFAGKGKPKQPIALGIHRQIKAAMPELSMNRIRTALQNYTNGPTYLRNVRSGTSRIGLDGFPDGTVTPEQQTIAKSRLAALSARYGKRRSA